ncbi:MAG: diguanylate cyclase [Leptolyngbyaceae bacterium]|nr:diguanylate cyclase [Leptolyngbyaceae bacterium]
MSQEQPSIVRANILVVDDSPANITLLTQILSSQGYTVRVVSNGQLAVQAAQLEPPNLILLDVHLPDLDGYEVCWQLKADQRTRDIPVIFCSTVSEVFEKVQAFTVGGVDYITKPYEPVEILARIENQLRWRSLQIQLVEQNAQLQLLLTATQAISEAEDVGSALTVILTQVCQTLGWDFGEAWIPNSDGTALECDQTWYASDASLAEFRQQHRVWQIPPNLGLVGRVWFSKTAEWMEDAAQATEFAFLAPQCFLGAEFQSALGVPILSQDQVLAVLVFFQKKHLVSDPRALELVNAVATQLGTMIQRKTAEAALKQANSKLERLASLDGLTQVANRRRFDEYLAQEWRRSLREQQPLSLILCDVDYFKAYNDHYGHQGGDCCLQQIAKAMGQVAGRPADLVARYGGEEFAVILPNTEGEGATRVAEAVRDRIQKLQLLHDQSPVSAYVTLSLGISSVVPTPDLSPEDLIAAADRALYQAKKQGRDRIVVDKNLSSAMIG